MYTTPSPEGLEFPEPNKRAGSLHCISIYMHTFYETALFKTMEKHCNYRITCNTYKYIHIHCNQSSISVRFFSINSMGVHIRSYRSWEEKRQVTHQTIHEVHHGEEELTGQGLAAQNSKLGIDISNMSMNKLFPGIFV